MGEIMEFSVKGCPSSFNLRTLISAFEVLAVADLENRVARPTPESTGASRVAKVLRLAWVESMVFLSEMKFNVMHYVGICRMKSKHFGVKMNVPG
jgi:hypothetical protein